MNDDVVEPAVETETEEDGLPVRTPRRRLIVDAHEDIAWNTLCYGRDYALAAHEIRAREEGAPYLEGTGSAMLGLPEWRRGGVAVVLGTIFTMPERRVTDPFSRFYRTPEEAHELAKGSS